MVRVTMKMNLQFHLILVESNVNSYMCLVAILLNSTDLRDTGWRSHLVSI